MARKKMLAKNVTDEFNLSLNIDWAEQFLLKNFAERNCFLIPGLLMT